METFVYQPKGVCSSKMEFEMDGDVIRSVQIQGGCSGNLQGICRILRNKTIDEVLEAFDGVKCGFKATSCPDQIAAAMKQYRSMHE